MATISLAPSVKNRIMQLTQFGAVRWAMRQAIRVVVPGRRIGASVAVFNEQGDVLLLKHAFHGAHPWALPGGWLNRTEDPADAVARELKEETGLSAEIQAPIHVTTAPPFNAVNIYFVGTKPQGDIALSYEIIDSGWFAPDALPPAMLPKNRVAIRAAVEHWEAQR